MSVSRGFSRRIHAPSPDGTFRESKWFYERARGQYADARAGLTAAQRRKFDIENPRRQLFTKTDLAKFVNVWEGRPHEVSLGAQKNFAAFAKRVLVRHWQTRPLTDFNEGVVSRSDCQGDRLQGHRAAGFRPALVPGRVSRQHRRLCHRQDWHTMWERREARGGFPEASGAGRTPTLAMEAALTGGRSRRHRTMC